MAVGLIAAVLAAAMSALITRCFEHSFWLKLVPGNVGSPLTIGVITRLAPWSVSSLTRLTYALNGSSWAIRTSGLVLLAVSIIIPVLLAGISQTDHVDITSTSALIEKISILKEAAPAIFSRRYGRVSLEWKLLQLRCQSQSVIMSPYES